MDLITKISDVKGIQDICKLVVVPLMAAAYITSTGFNIVVDDFSISVAESDTGFKLWFFFLIVFFGKVLWVAFWAALAGGAVLVCELKSSESSKIFSIILLCFGFMGIASPDLLPIHEFMNPYWYYSAIAAGFYLPKLTADVYGEKT